jgi:ketosteroid isomerase-like protein
MTSDATAVVRAYLDLVAAGDYAAVSDRLDSDVVWFGTRGGLDEAQTVRGPDACIEYLREIVDPWQRFDFEAERLIDVGDTVVVFLRETARARHGDLRVENETAMIFKLRRQKIVEMRGYLDRDEALRAVGATD